MTNKFSGSSLIEMVDVGVRFDGPGGGVWAVKDVSLSIRPGQMVALLGASGSGKSTLLALAGLLRRPTTGQVTFLGQPVADLSERGKDELRRDHVGFVFQNGALIEHLTLLQNVMVPLLAERSRARVERARELLTSVGLAEHIDKLPSTVSGGQAQRAGFCRAIIHEPEVVLADEPTASLDAEAAKGLLGLMRNYVDQGGSALIATHDPRVAEASDSFLDLSNWAVSPR